ncbi:hypothetical protein FB451DRAFT_1179034 [Mycena latifolia]|nr:hypothetical protein FB451DRAFT_1179034 [Mycena latifolia]
MVRFSSPSTLTLSTSSGQPTSTASVPTVVPTLGVGEMFWKRLARLTARTRDHEDNWISGPEIRLWKKLNTTVKGFIRNNIVYLIANPVMCKPVNSKAKRSCTIEADNPSCVPCRTVKTGCDRKTSFSRRLATIFSRHLIDLWRNIAKVTQVNGSDTIGKVKHSQQYDGNHPPSSREPSVRVGLGLRPGLDCNFSQVHKTTEKGEQCQGRRAIDNPEKITMGASRTALELPQVFFWLGFFWRIALVNTSPFYSCTAAMLRGLTASFPTITARLLQSIPCQTQPATQRISFAVHRPTCVTTSVLEHRTSDLFSSQVRAPCILSCISDETASPSAAIHTSLCASAHVSAPANVWVLVRARLAVLRPRASRCIDTIHGTSKPPRTPPPDAHDSRAPGQASRESCQRSSQHVATLGHWRVGPITTTQPNNASSSLKICIGATNSQTSVLLTGQRTQALTQWAQQQRAQRSRQSQTGVYLETLEFEISYARMGAASLEIGAFVLCYAYLFIADVPVNRVPMNEKTVLKGLRPPWFAYYAHIPLLIVQ